MPGFETEDIEASVRMLEVADTGAILVFNGRNKAVLETLGVCLQHHKPLLVDRNESISAEMEASNNEDDPKPKIKQELQQDVEVEEDFNDKLMMDQDFSDSEDESEELPIEYGERNEDFEDECDLSISDEEEEDQNANKSFELSDDDAGTMSEVSATVSTDSPPKESYQEYKMKEVKALLKKLNKVWSCKSCGYSNKKKRLVTLHAETHVSGLMLPCKYCPKVFSRTLTLGRHTHKNHRGEHKQRASILKNQREAEKKAIRSKEELDKEIDEKVVNMMEKDEGQLWKCKQCDKISNRANLKRHCEIHLIGYSFPCQMCSHKTTNRIAMKEHVRIKHRGK